MKVFSLMYHDVVRRAEQDASGFPGGDANLYKLEPALFAQHLAALAGALAAGPSTVGELEAGTMSSTPWLLTFDDGGVSAYTEIADRLEEKNWRGHFLIATGFISRRGFLSSEQIRELRRRGHVIGTHSDSHPLRMAACSWEQLVREWSTSVAKLSDILGEQVKIASVPGGHYSRRVAEAAARAGISALFTSEPIARSYWVGDCLVLGRYTVQRWTSPQTAVALAAGRRAPRWRQFLLWNGKKFTKRLGGAYYLKVRQALLNQAK